MNINDVYDKLDSLENDVENKISTLQELVEAQSRVIDRLESLLDGLDNRL
jgi:archaellum component FlaC